MEESKVPQLKLERIISDCSCHSPEHILHFVYDPNFGDLYTEIHLTPTTFFKRIKIAIKYLFGYADCGCFDCWMINNEDAEKIIELLERKQYFDIEEKKEWKERVNNATI